MTAFERYEREIPRLLDELAPTSQPDYLDDLLRSTATTRQRPAWSALERWLPMGEIARPLTQTTFPWRPFAVVALLAALIAAGLLISIGSSRGVPQPFGPAENGLLVYAATDGVIYQGDVETGAFRAIVSGEDHYSIPVVSRNGQRIAYDHTAGGTTYFVADIDGSDARPLAGTYQDVRSIGWSPDDSTIGITSLVDDRPTLTLLAADGSGATTLDLGREVRSFVWLPDHRLAFIGGEAATDVCRFDVPEPVCALFLVDADGTDLEMILPAADFRGLMIDPSPDGRSLLYVRWDEVAEGLPWIVDLSTHDQHQVPFENRDPAGLEAINHAWFSPDGESILFDRFLLDAEYWAILPVGGGDAVNVGPAWPREVGRPSEARWSPDGTSVLAFYPGISDGDVLRVLDPTTEGLGEPLEFSAPDLPSWQRTGP